MSQSLFAGLKSATVLVVDDKPAMGREIARAIRPSCGHVIVSDPKDARRHLRESDVSLLLTDLRMPGNGAASTAIGLLQGLNKRILPPVVITTGSVPHKELERLKATATTSAGVPAFRTVLKGTPAAGLLAEAAQALADAKVASAADRWETISALPTELPLSTSDILAEQKALVHEIYQDLKIFVSVMERGIASLKKHCELDTWPEWKNTRVSIEGQLALLKQYTKSSDAFYGSLREVADTLHNLRPAAMLCDMGRVEIPSASARNSHAKKIADILGAYHAEFVGCLNRAYRSAEESLRAEIPCSELFVKRLPPNVIHENSLEWLNRQRAFDVTINDPGGKLRSFFEELKAIVATDPLASLDLRYEAPKDVHQAGYFDPIGLKANKRWGGWFCVNLTMLRGFTDEKPTWAYLESLAPRFFELKDSLYLPASEMNADEAGDPCTFYLRTHALDEREVANEQKRVDGIKIKGTDQILGAGGDRLYVTTLYVAGKKCVVIGEHEFDKKAPLYGDFSLQVLEDTLLFSCNTVGHTFADAQLYSYLKTIGEKSPQDAMAIARESVRGKLFSAGKYALNVSEDADEELKDYGVPDVMSAFGYPTKQDTHFTPRTALSYSQVREVPPKLLDAIGSDSMIAVTSTVTRRWNGEGVSVVNCTINGEPCVLITKDPFDRESPLVEDFCVQYINGAFVIADHEMGHSFADMRMYSYLANERSVPKDDALKLTKSSVRGKLVGSMVFAFCKSELDKVCMPYPKIIRLMHGIGRDREAPHEHFASRSFAGLSLAD